MPNTVYVRTFPRFLEIIERFVPDDVELIVADANSSIEEQAEILKPAKAVFTMPSTFPIELAEALPDLRLVQVFSAGTEQMDKAALGELGVQVGNNNGGNSPAVAEHAVTLMVSTLRRLDQQFAAVLEGKWAGDFMLDWMPNTFELTGKTVGIIGLGRIGRQVAQRLAGWDCDIIYNDIVEAPVEVEQELNVRRVELEELLSTADIVTLHTPHTAMTEGIISDAEFDLMKPSAILVNTCRGPVVDESALERAILGEKIAAAGIDVTTVEPPDISNPILHMDRIVVSPHLAGLSFEAAERSCRFAIENALRVEAGEEPQSIVRPGD